MERTKSKVQVIARVRPVLNESDKAEVYAIDDKTVETFNHRNIEESLLFEFSKVNGPESTQTQMYKDTVEPLLKYTLNGQNTTVFAYGPTGAGKTFTMLGSPKEPGIIPRTVCGIFQSIHDQQAELTELDHQWKVYMSFLEIYNERVQDFLNTANHDLPVREDGNRNIFIQGLTEEPIESFEDFKFLFGPASEKRTTAATKLNEHSSRSHSVVMFKVIKTHIGAPHKKLVGKMFLIDLAGSENNKRTGNQGIRLQESGAINKSLSVLGQVVDALNNHRPRIPYRDSKLTRILQDTLGGTSHTIMIINIAPEMEHYRETYSTLNFAKKSKKIVNTTHVHEITDPPVLTPKRPLDVSGSESEDGPTPRKQTRMTPPGWRTPPETPKTPKLDPAPFLSPLLRRQNAFEESMVQRLCSLEETLIKQIHEATLNISTLNMSNLSDLSHSYEDREQSSASDSSDSASDSSDSSLEQTVIHRSIVENARDGSMLSDNTGNITDLVSAKQRKEVDLKSPKQGYVEGKDIDLKSPKQGYIEGKDIDLMSQKQGQLKECDVLLEKLKKERIEKVDQLKRYEPVGKENQCFESPLFAKTSLLKRKGTKKSKNAKVPSTNLRSPLPAKPKPFSDVSNNQVQMPVINHELQRKHNASVLKILNTGSVKDLKTLQTVGDKRARLMAGWREIHGPFSKIEDLKMVSGLTAKYVDTFIKSNLVSMGYE